MADWTGLYNDPGFQTLSYQQQQSTISGLLSDELNQDPAFQQLDLMAKQKAFTAILQDKMPAFADPTFRDWANAVIPSFNQAREAAKSGDPKAQDTINQIMSGVSHMELTRASGVARFTQQFVDWSGLTQLMNNDQNSIIQKYPLTGKLILGKDAQKFLDYMTFASKDINNASAWTMERAVDKMAGVIGDVAVTAAFLGNPLGKTLDAAGAVAAAKKSTSAIRWMFRVALPFLGRTTVEDAALTLSDYYRNGDDLSKTTATEFGKRFGEWAALDYLIGGAATVAMPFLSGAVRGLFKRGAGNWKNIKSPEDLQKVFQGIENGTIDPAVLKEAPSFIQDSFEMRKNARLAAAHLDNLDAYPIEQATLAASGSGAMFAALDDGTYRITTIDEAKSAVQTIHQDLVTANRQLAALAAQKVADLPDGVVDTVKAADPALANIQTVEETLKKLYSPAERVGFIGIKDRPYVSRAEADALAKGTDGAQTKVLEFTADSTRFAAKDIRNNLTPVDVMPGGEKNAIIALTNEAPAQEVGAASALAAKIQNPNVPQEQVRDIVLQKAGYDHFVNPDGSVHLLYPDQAKLVSANVNPSTGGVGSPENVLHSATPNAVRAQAYAEQQFKVSAGAKTLTRNDQLMVDTLASFTGDVNTGKLQKLSQMYLKELGVDTSELSVKVKGAQEAAQEGAVFARINGNKIEISVPKAIRTASEQKKFISELMDEYQNIAQTKGKARGAARAKPGSVFENIYQQSITRYVPELVNPIARESWIRSVIDEMHGTIGSVPGGISVSLPGGVVQEFSNLEEVLNSLVKSSMDVGGLKAELAQQGYRLIELRDGGLAVKGPGLGKGITGRTPQDIMERLNFVPTKLDARFAPKVAEISDSAVSFNVTGRSALGSRKQLLEFFNNFEDKNYVLKMRKLGSTRYGDLAAQPDGRIRVTLPAINSTMEFGSLAEARKFAEGGWKDLVNVEALAEKKGLKMRFDNGVWTLNDGQTLNVARNREGVYKILKSYPDATDGVPDVLAGLDPNISREVEESVLEYRSMLKEHQIPKPGLPPQVPPEIGGEVRAMGARTVLKAYTTNQTTWMEGYARTTGNTVLLGKYRELENAMRFATGKSHASTMALDRVFHETGKMLKKDRRRALFYHMGAQSPDELAAALEEFGPLTEAENRIKDNLRALYDALGTEFNIDPRKLIENYMPRIRRYADNYENSALVTAATNAEELTSYVFHDGVPKEIKFWAENDRLEELLSFAADDDAYSVAAKYINQGYKKLYLQQTWKDLHKTMMDQKKLGVIDAFAFDRMNRYRELVMGTFKPETQARLEHAGKLFMTNLTESPIISKLMGKDRLGKLGWESRKAAIIESGQNLPKTMFSLNYFGSMGWRWWLAMRNNFQVWVTLAPRFGLDWTAKAVKYVDQAGPEFYDYLMHLGVVSGQAPVVTKLLAADTFIGKMTEQSMKMFKNSDEYTRAIAYATATLRWEDAVSAWKKGAINQKKQFLDISGLDMMSPDIANRSFDFFQQGITKGDDVALTAGRDVFAAQVTHDTMFGYRASESPMINHSFLGKMFGQYGTYAAGYRANIFNAIRYGSPAKKAAFVGRFLAINGALYGSFAALGINATDFIPGLPGLFSGGPMFQTAVDIMTMFGSSQESAQARARVERAFLPISVSEKTGAAKFGYPGLMPGTIQYNYLKKAYHYALDGDSWNTWLALSTIPARKDGPWKFQ